jgi:hypothetical protein
MCPKIASKLPGEPETYPETVLKSKYHNNETSNRDVQIWCASMQTERMSKANKITFGTDYRATLYPIVKRTLD